MPHRRPLGGSFIPVWVHVWCISWPMVSRHLLRSSASLLVGGGDDVDVSAAGRNRRAGRRPWITAEMSPSLSSSHLTTSGGSGSARRVMTARLLAVSTRTDPLPISTAAAAGGAFLPSPSSSPLSLSFSFSFSLSRSVAHGGKLTLLASASLRDVSPCCVGGTDVMDSRMATSGGETLRGTRAYRLLRSLMHRSKWTSPQQPMTYSPVSRTLSSTDGSALCSSRKPLATASKSCRCFGSTLTRTIAALLLL
mmetsp:Transcript_20479/g.58487  ORF Transcript_20479/g.58487 Transcript_20479/m.58487 type:complete len:251 (-) Transcript_20479:423-1175(-)